MSSHAQVDLISDHSKEKLTEVPKDVLEMKNLKMLFLEGNFLYKLPQGFFWKLPRLMWLDLRNNQLEGIPRSIAYHQHLENVLLNNNNISRLPNELGLVPNLKVLQLSENPLIYPSRKIVAGGTKAVRNYLKAQYEMTNPVPNIIDSNENIESEEEIHQETLCEESSSSEEKINIIKKEEKRKIYNKIVKDLKKKVEDPYSLQPTLHVKQITGASTAMCKRRPEPAKIVHKITREGSKILMKSCLNKIGVRDNLSKQTNDTLREGWLNQLRILLIDQERIIQQERNLKALSNWRKKTPPSERPISPKVFRDKNIPKIIPPYATYSEYSKTPSREDLAKKVEVFFKNREISKRGLQKKLNIEKLIIDLMEQLKEMEHTYTSSRSAKSEIEEAGKQIQTIMEIHKKLLDLKRSNDSLLY